MKVKLQISNVVKSFGTQDILTGASLQVRGNEKIALVGRNGCGKTTLLKIICGLEDMDSGSRVLASGTKIGYLSQITFEDESKTVHEELLSVFDEVKALEQQLNEQAMILADDHSQKQLDKYDRLQQRFEMMGGYEYEVEIKNVFYHFQFEESDLQKPLSQFSSGQRTRIGFS